MGINKGSVKSHKKFATRNHLHFPLLSDPGLQVTKAYGAWRKNPAHSIFDKAYGTRRNTYIVDPQGMIVQEFLGVKVDHHVEDVIQSLQTLQNIVKT